MSKVYVDQTSFRLTCTVGVNVTGATVTQVRYCKPSGSTGQWTAGVSGSTAGILYVDGSTSVKFDEAGKWALWGYVTFSDTRSAPGEMVFQHIYLEGE